MRASSPYFALVLAFASQACFAQSENSAARSPIETPLMRLISAEEAISDPAQPEGALPRPLERPLEQPVSTGVTWADDCQLLLNDFCCDGDWRDNLEIWAGVDGFRTFGDAIPIPIFPVSLANSYGAVAGFNTTFALGDSPVRAQIGASYGVYDWKGRLVPLTNSSLEQQTFITFGFSKRSDVCHGDRIAWGIVFDQMFDHQWGFLSDEIYLSQIRFIGGYALNEANEIGFMGTFHTQSDVFAQILPGVFLGQIRTMNQANLFWRHNWQYGATTNAYVGILDSADIGDWLFGLNSTMPMSDHISFYSNFTYVAPQAATGTAGSAFEQWNISAGFVYSYGGKSVSPNVSGPQGLPLLPVANNGNFLVTD